jgi:hypothetical protein
MKCSTYNKIILRMPRLMNILDMEDGILRLPLYTSDTAYSMAMQRFFSGLEKGVIEEIESGEIVASEFEPSLLLSNTTNVIYRTGVLQLSPSPNTLIYDVASKKFVEELQKNRAVQAILHVAGVRVQGGVARLWLEPLLLYQFEPAQQEAPSEDESSDFDSETNHFSSNISDYSAYSSSTR